MWRQECHAINSRVYALLFTNATYNNYTPHTNTTHEHAYTVRIQDCSNQHLYTWKSSTLNNNTADLVNTFKSGLKSDFAIKRTSAHGWQSCPWVGLTHGSIWVEILLILVGWVGSTIENVLKIWKKCVSTCKARLRKICLHQAVKFHLRSIWPVPETDQKEYTAYKNTSLLNCKLHC